MLQIQTANLPQDQQQQLHPEFLANERTYLHMHDSLLASHQGQWVAVQDGKMIVAGPNLLEVMSEPDGQWGTSLYRPGGSGRCRCLSGPPRRFFIV